MFSKAREYRLEVFSVLVAAFGSLLIFFKSSFNGLLSSMAGYGANLWDYLNREASQDMRSVIDSIGLSTLAGLALILAVLLFLAWRIRYRFTNSDQWIAEQCPRCGADLHRIHRTAFDRLLSVSILPHACRYRCAGDQCGWSGLRRRRRHSQTHSLQLAE